MDGRRRGRCSFHEIRPFRLGRFLYRNFRRFRLRSLRRRLLFRCRGFCRRCLGRGRLPGLFSRPIVPEQVVHAHLAVDDGFAFGRLDLLVAAISAHFPRVDVVAQLQLQDVGELFHQYRVLHPHAHFHAALGVAGEEVAGGNVDAGMHPVKEAVNAAMLQIAAHQTADMQILGLAGHPGTHTADTAHDHVDAHPGAAGFLQLEDDIAVADGVVLQDHGRRAAHAGSCDHMIHLIQQYALEPQRSHQHPVALLGELLHGQIAEHLGGFLADALICRDEGIVGVELTGLFVVVAGTDLGDVGVAVGLLTGDEGELGVHLVVIEAVDHGAARIFQLLRPVDVVLLVKAGAQLHQRHHFLAVFGGFHQGLHDLRFPRHAVQGHLDGDDIRVTGGLFEHVDEGPDGLVRVAQQHIVLLHFLGQIIVWRRQHGPGSRVEQAGVVLCFNAPGELVEKAQVQRALLHKDSLARQLQTAAQQTLHLRGGLRRDLQAHSRQLAAALEQLGHDLTIVDVVIHHAFLDVDVRIAGDPEQAAFQDTLLAKDAGRIVQHQLFHQCKLRFAVLFYEVQPLHLAGDGDDAQALGIGVLLPQKDTQVDLLVAQERERVAAVHDLRAEDGEQLRLEVFFPEALILLAQVVKIHLAVAAPGQLFQRFGIVFVAVRLQLGRLGHDGCQLFGCGHVGLVLALFLFALALFQVGALLQRADAHHKEFVQIGTVDGQKFDLLGKGHVFVLAKGQDPAVEVQPAQFPVDKNGLVAHIHSPLCLTASFVQVCLPLPALPRRPQGPPSGPARPQRRQRGQRGRAAAGTRSMPGHGWARPPARCTGLQHPPCSGPHTSAPTAVCCPAAAASVKTAAAPQTRTPAPRTAPQRLHRPL